MASNKFVFSDTPSFQAPSLPFPSCQEPEEARQRQEDCRGGRHHHQRPEDLRRAQDDSESSLSVRVWSVEQSSMGVQARGFLLLGGALELPYTLGRDLHVKVPNLRLESNLSLGEGKYLFPRFIHRKLWPGR